MKKTLLTLFTVASLGMAQSALAAVGDMGSESFQWAGTVPAAGTVKSGYWIVSADGQSLLSNTNTHDGVLTMENKAGVVNLIDSSAFSFKVVTDAGDDGVFDPAQDKTGAAYNVSLAKIKSGSGAFPTDGDQDGYFTITANGTAVSTTVSKAYIANNLAQIKVGKADGKASLTGATAGQKWQVVAELAVSTTAL